MCFLRFDCTAGGPVVKAPVPESWNHSKCSGALLEPAGFFHSRREYWPIIGPQMRHATRPNQEHDRSFSKHCQDSCTSSIRQRGGTVGWSLLYLTGCPSSLRRRRVHHIPVADHSNQTLRFLNEQILATVCLMSAGVCRNSIAFDSKCETDRIRPMSCICKVLRRAMASLRP